MLDAAEEIACEIGIGAITLSGVQERSGQANKSAASYHFGSRQGLLAAMLARRMIPIERHRHQLLASAGDSAGLAALCDALVRPLAVACLGVPESRYARFLAQAMIDPHLGTLALTHPESGSFREIRTLIQRHLDPDGSEPLIDQRIAAVMSMVVTTLALREGHPQLPDPERAIDDLVAMCLAALSAPLPVHRNPDPSPPQPGSRA